MLNKRKTFRDLLLAGSVIGMMSFGLIENSYGQEQPSRRNRADGYYSRMEYANAAKAYENLVDVKKPKVSDMERLANSYLYIKEYELASNWYARVVSQAGASEESHLNYALSLQQQGKYAEAKAQYHAYVSKYGSSEKLSKLITGTDSAQVWMKNPTFHKLRNEQAVNTELANFGVYPTSGGALFATEPNSIVGAKSGMTGQSYLRVYSASRGTDGSLSNPTMMLDKFNDSRYHVGPVSANAAEDVLYVTRTYPGESAEKYRADGYRWRKQNLELKIYRKDGSSWKEEDFAYNKVKEYSLGHASLSSDGKTLYYASDMPGGKGGVDIWYSELQGDGSWGLPQNAGDAINTAGDEMFPSVFENTLYFSSTGHVGMGGLDVFQSSGSKNNWSKAKNMGYPVNSASDDFSFVTEGKGEGSSFGYLSSNRAGGAGSDDIYSYNFATPKITITLEGITKDKNTGALLPGSMVTLFDGNRSIVSRGQTDKDAKVSFSIDANTPYRLLGEKTGYFPDSLLVAGVKATKDTTIRVTLNLQPVFKVGDKFVLENIYYDFDKHNIRTDAALILDKLVATMRDNPTLKIELSSHTDSRGTHKYNEDLSSRRAKAAVEYIISRGIARDRLVAKGYGETRLVNKCSDGVKCTPAEHQANRRTEVEILEY